MLFFLCHVTVYTPLGSAKTRLATKTGVNGIPKRLLSVQNQNCSLGWQVRVRPI